LGLERETGAATIARPHCQPMVDEVEIDLEGASAVVNNVGTV
jgi:hypothetical protein